MTDLRAYLRDCRKVAVAEIERFVPRENGVLGRILYDLVLDYPLREAKGLRPALCIAACRALGGLEEAALPTAAVLELYHNAFLLHDDVEDGSEKRRDRPTLHREHGAAVAINVGDTMLALALGPLVDNTRVVGLGKTLRILEVIAKMARETGEGQALELEWIRRGEWSVADDDYREMVVKKTAWYSFIAPVTLGAIIAEAPQKTLEDLHSFARELGIAFQIRDDLLNLDSDEARYGKERGGDLWEGKRTLMLLHALRQASTRDRTRAIDILSRDRPSAREGATIDPALLDLLEAEGELTSRARQRLELHLSTQRPPTKTAEDIAFLMDLIRRAESMSYADGIARDHAARARRHLDRAALPPSVHADLLGGLIDYCVGRDT